jgi:hypothetical protein
MHPIVAAVVIAVIWMTFSTVRFYWRGDVQRALFWLVALIAVLLAANVLR